MTVGMVVRKVGPRPQTATRDRSEQIARNEASLVVVGAGAEVGLQAGRDPQIGVPQPVHGQHQFDLRLVDLHHPDVGRDSEEEHHRQEH
jgi:hypothetical protein